MTPPKAILTTVAGAGLLVLVGHMAFSYHRVTRFRSVPGTVLSAKLSSGIKGKFNSVTYKPIIRYSYVVDGVRYNNNEFDPLSSDGTEDWASGVVQHYPPGGSCDVYYDPSNPRTSVLSTSPKDGSYWSMAAGAFEGLIIFTGGVLALRWGSGPTTDRR
jgi:hypothetical protein